MWIFEIHTNSSLSTNISKDVFNKVWSDSAIVFPANLIALQPMELLMVVEMSFSKGAMLHMQNAS